MKCLLILTFHLLEKPKQACLDFCPSVTLENVCFCYLRINKSTVCNKTFFSIYYSIYVRSFLSYLELTYIPFGNKMSRAVVDVSAFAHYQKTDTLILIKDCFNYCMHAMEGYKFNRVFTRIVLIKWRTLKCMFYFTTLAPWRSYATCRRLTPPHSPGLHFWLY